MWVKQQHVSSTPSGIFLASAPRLWTPGQGSLGLIAVAEPRPLSVVLGGRVFETRTEGAQERERRASTALGGWTIVSKRREPGRIVGHPDLASGASVQRGDVLYVSVAEAIYRETRGEDVEVHMMPTPEDNDALSELRARARYRWENDKLPDGWTRPLPSPKDEAALGRGDKDRHPGLSEELRALAERFRA